MVRDAIGERIGERNVGLEHLDATHVCLSKGCLSILDASIGYWLSSIYARYRCELQGLDTHFSWAWAYFYRNVPGYHQALSRSDVCLRYWAG